MGFGFSLVKTDGKARRGKMHTRRGTVDTPAFMPVGTQATVKATPQSAVAAMGYRLILANTYHLYLRPGLETIEAGGGLHEFMAWQGPILTDSGGYQVASQQGLRTIDDIGVAFRSYLDGTEHLFTPEIVVRLQARLGVDIGMVLDECPRYGVGRDGVAKAVRRTHDWARRSLDEHERIGRPYALFGIAQGETYDDLRAESAETIAAMPFDGYAVGGLSVGEPKELMWPAMEVALDRLPTGRVRYVMGVGTPVDILEAVARGADLFDCVLPTRLGRNATVYTSCGRVNLRDAPCERDFGPVDPDCDCECCRRYTRAYIHHLYRSGEILAAMLLTHHNLVLYARLMADIRTAIEQGCFEPFRAEYSARFGE